MVRKRRAWPARFARNVLLLLLPAAVIWALLTPLYNRVLAKSGENLVRVTESPRVTRLNVHKTHYLAVTRSDFPRARGILYSFRLSDMHFPLILVAALFLAVPGLPRRQRWSNLGWAVLISVVFHVVSVFFHVKFGYALKLGSWSQEHYGVVARNFFGLSKHLLDLPFKFALPMILWAAFYLPLLLDRQKG